MRTGFDRGGFLIKSKNAYGESRKKRLRNFDEHISVKQLDLKLNKYNKIEASENEK